MSTSVSLLDRVQRKAIWLIDDPSITSTLQSLAHRRAAVSLSFFSRYYFDFCLSSFSSCYFHLLFSHTGNWSSLSGFCCLVSLSLFQSSFPPGLVNCGTLPLYVFLLTYSLSLFKTRVKELVLTWTSPSYPPQWGLSLILHFALCNRKFHKTWLPWFGYLSLPPKNM